MRREANIHAVEVAIPHKIGTTKKLFLCWRSNNFDRACQPLCLHSRFHGKGTRNQHSTIRIVPFTVPRSPFRYTALIKHSRNLRIIRICIIFGMNPDHRRSTAVSCNKSRWKSPNTKFNLKARFLEQITHQLAGPVFLHTKLAKIENAVIEQGNGFEIALDEGIRDHFGFICLGHLVFL